MATTPRWGLRYPVGTDAADVPLWMQHLATDLDDVAKDDQGLLANRPVSTPASPGKRGRYYYATDTGQLFRDHGTGWHEIPLNTVSSRLFQPTLLTATQTSNQSLLGGTVDLPGLSVSVTPTVASKALVWASVNVVAERDRAAYISCNVDGVDQAFRTGVGVRGMPANYFSSHSATGLWVVSLTAAAHTIKIRGGLSGGGAGYLDATGGFMAVMLVAQ